ncbi:MAG: hypothetical protein AAFY38_05195 [Pseudomonadota bacterium]
MIKRLTLTLAVLAAPAAASNVFTPPEGCTPQLTIQTRSCKVENIYTCASDAPGDKWRAVSDQSGPIFVSRIDDETQWMESYELFPTVRTQIRLPAEDPASLTELLETGIDTYDFVQESGGRIVRVVGYDRLTGDDVLIDDEPLLGTEFSVRYEDFNGVYLTVTGTEYVSVRHRRFIGGLSTRTWGEVSEDRDHSPVEFIYPGEDGFFATKPKYDCEETLASFRPRS